MLVRGIIGLNQTRLRKILAYSSINHIGWIIASIIFIQTIWTYYFLIYSFITTNIVLIFKFLNRFYIKQLFSTLNYNNNLKIFFILNFLSLGGLPPFIGFIPKWITIQALVQNNSITLALIIIVITLITLYFYIRLSFRSLLLNRVELNLPIFQLKRRKILNTFFLNFLIISSLIYCTLIFNWI